MTVAPGYFSRNASASSAVMKSPETNSPAPSMKKQRSASPSQAMPMSAFSATTRSTMSRRFSSMSGLASWFGKRAVDVEAQTRRPAGQALEQLRRHQPAHAAAGIEHDVERLDDRRIDERHHVLDVARRAHPSCVTRARARPAGAGRRSFAIMSRMSRDPVVAAQRKRLLRAPSSCRCTASGLCDAVICAPPSCPSRATAKYSMSVGNHAVVDDVGALLRRAVDERRGERRRRQAHVACRPRSVCAFRYATNAAADRARGVLVDLARDTCRGRRTP